MTPRKTMRKDYKLFNDIAAYKCFPTRDLHGTIGPTYGLNWQWGGDRTSCNHVSTLLCRSTLSWPVRFISTASMGRMSGMRRLLCQPRCRAVELRAGRLPWKDVVSVHLQQRPFALEAGLGISRGVENEYVVQNVATQHVGLDGARLGGLALLGLMAPTARSEKAYSVSTPRRTAPLSP